MYIHNLSRGKKAKAIRCDRLHPSPEYWNAYIEFKILNPGRIRVLTRVDRDCRCPYDFADYRSVV